MSDREFRKSPSIFPQAPIRPKTVIAIHGNQSCTPQHTQFVSAFAKFRKPILSCRPGVRHKPYLVFRQRASVVATQKSTAVFAHDIATREVYTITAWEAV